LAPDRKRTRSAGRSLPSLESAEGRQALLAAIVDSSRDAIYAGDVDGTILTWNAAAERLFGYPAREIIGRSIAVLYPPDSASERDRIVAAVRAGEPPAYLETTRLRKEGSLVRVALTISPIRDQRGSVIGASAIARDITERDLAADALRMSEEKFERVFRSVPAGISVSDLADGRLLEVNDEFLRIFGYTRDETLGRTSVELGIWMEPAQRSQFISALVAAGGMMRDHELRLQSKDRQVLRLRSSSHVTRLHDRAVLLSAFVDVTATRQAEQALHLSEQKFGTIFRESPIALAVSERDTGRFVDVNPALVQLLGGRTPDQIVGKTSIEIGMVTAADRRREIIDAVASGRTTGLTVPMRRLNGEPFTAELAVSEYRVDDKPYLLTSIVDITERLRMDDERRLAEQKYRELVDGVRDVIFALTPQGLLTSLNPAFQQITGWSAQEWLGRPFVDLIHPDDRDDAMARFGVALRNEPRPMTAVRIRTASGVYRIGEFQLTPREENGRVVSVLGIARDVSERIQLESELRQAQKMEAVGRLAGGVAHDFNNLLTVIITSGQLALAEMGDRPERADVEDMVTAAQRAAELTRQLLAFSRRQLLEPRILDLNAVLANIEKLLRRLIGEDITLLTTPSRDLGLVRADPGQIEQVIANLAVNARDAMPSGGTLTITTANIEMDEAFVRDHRGAEPGPYIRLAISDTGSGMTADVKSHLFEPFFTTKETGKGTGLGLSTVYGIVQQSGGRIWVQSELGHGSTFEIYLPRVQAPGAEVAEKTAPPEALTGNETVLVAEDDAAVRELVVRVLKGYGYVVLSAPNGEAALKVAAEHPQTIHLLITDVVMPKMSGSTLATRLREARPATRVLYVTGYTDDDLLPEKAHASGTALLQKPITPAALGQKVRQLLDGD